jgi:hypothetical protein
MAKGDRDDETKERAGRERKPARLFTQILESNRPQSSNRRALCGGADDKKARRLSAEQKFKGQSTKRPWSEEEDRLVTR